MEKEREPLKIIFTVDAFEKQVERSGLHDCKKFTKHVAEMNKFAEVLDRYDEFGSLTLSPSDYAKKNTPYGIEKKKFHSGNRRILEHQEKAAYKFLKELRGFGLLADVVGSGKTYEAGVVLSELAAKGKISTALIIAPSQVYNTWVSVLEKDFGMGEGVLKTVGAEFNEDYFTRCDDGMIRPVAPIIVKTEDFVKWREQDVQDVLFDVVVVDEAHNLCSEEGSSAKAIKMLSILMLTKKRAKKTYCVLLSATPHSGNLENMFRLWYFIRCKGGNPSDFDEKDDSQRTADYRKEKEYYKKHICRGAISVMDFINKVKIIEVTEKFGDVFSAFLEKKNCDTEKFNGLLDGEKKKIVNEFLSANEPIKKAVIKNIANAYHNGVLRSIMIRQPNDRIRKSKKIENFLFFPAENKGNELKVKGLNGKNITVVVDKMYEDGGIKTDTAEYSLREYVRSNAGNQSFGCAFADLFFDDGILKAFGLTDDKFLKKDSVKYYWQQMRRTQTSASGDMGNDVNTTFIPVFDGNVFISKLTELYKILVRHSEDRVIVFFDYDIEKNQACCEKVLEALNTDQRFENRVIIGDKSDKSVTEKLFNEKPNAILVVTDGAFTEGANLQKSSVIVNFQITPNPLGMEQSIGRIFRLGQENDVVIYSFADMCALEGYVLTYFSSIGLMTSNSGDAAIIAGSNNDNMVTIRCPACKNVKLMSKEDYEACKKEDDDSIYCCENEECRQDGVRGKLMVEINSCEIKCENCGSLIKRRNSKEGGQYMCLAVNNSGKGGMCNNGEKGDRQLYCKKICAIAHCDKFANGYMKGKCEALNYYIENPSANDLALMEKCENCDYKSECPSKCRVRDGADAISGCMNCEHATCFPKPHVISFNDKWEAECPVCGEKLKPVVAKTFETYIRSAYDYLADGGKSFCDNLLKETAKVSEIQEILSNDRVGE